MSYLSLRNVSFTTSSLNVSSLTMNNATFSTLTGSTITDRTTAVSTLTSSTINTTATSLPLQVGGTTYATLTSSGAFTVGNYLSIIPGTVFTLPGSSSVATPFYLPVGGMYMVSTHTLGTIASGGGNNQQWYAVSIVDYNVASFIGWVTAVSSNNATMTCSATGQITVTAPAGSTSYTTLQWSITAIRLA